VLNRTIDDVYKMDAFDCTIWPKTGSDNVRTLRPADINIVMAMGDSITAGFGADAGSIFTVFTEYRGLSWSIGGDKTVDTYTTIPNLIKKYNANVQGFSVATGKQSSSNARLNQAVTGAVSSGLAEQALSLIYMLEDGQKQGKWNINTDWKLLTIFIGCNNLCDYCNDKNTNAPAKYMAEVEQAIDAIQSRIPRVFVNLVQPVDVTLLGVLSTGLCSLLHPFECPCATGSGVQPARDAWSQYTQALRDIAGQAKYKVQDFAVSVQPFFLKTKVPTLPDGSPDHSYFAPDCFHFSTKAHMAAGVGLWNNMFEAEGSKEEFWYIGEKYDCPAEHQFIQ